MIKMPNLALTVEVNQALRRYQDEIDAIPDYAARVQAGKDLFKSRNVTTNAAFRVVRDTLSRMCSGARRCVYCENSIADEVEHIWPKDLYPEKVFVWENYLYICGPCNGGKLNRFLVLLPPDDRLQDVTRRRGSPIIAPPANGRPVLIDPRQEDGLVFMQLDLSGTFWFVPFPSSEPSNVLRAEKTIEILKLNSREHHVKARKGAFGYYRALLREYAEDKQKGVSAERLNELRTSLLAMDHPTVWAEMKRQKAQIPSLAELFNLAPEALDWKSHAETV